MSIKLPTSRILIKPQGGGLGQSARAFIIKLIEVIEIPST
jgi:hypothetical protein